MSGYPSMSGVKHGRHEAQISIRDLTYTYPGRAEPALRQLSLEVESGEFILLTGVSGAGKSTLLRTLNGLAPHFTGGSISGRVRVAGQDPLSAGPQALSRQVGFVFQNPEAQAVMELVEAEIAFGMENAAFPLQKMRLRMEEALDQMELVPLRQRPLRELSGGERQRVAIAAALALQPKILALDEPTSQLDPKAAQSLLQMLVRLNEDLGLTIVLAEHRLERVLRYADRVVHLRAGRIVLDGPVREILPELTKLPPVAELGRQLGWRPLPLTVKEARRHVRVFPAREERDTPPVPAQENILLDVDGVSFSYEQGAVLRDVSLRVHAGETVALMGRNGSGKTTLLKCIVGLLKPAAGEISVAGKSTSGREVADICRELAYLPQFPDDLLFAESVRQELLTTLHYHGPAQNGDHEQRVAALLEQLALADEAERYPRDLSVGQRQRVALGAVMVTRPMLLLLDEPTRGLDSAAKEKLAAIWKTWQNAGMGLLIVTHDVELVAQVADRVIVMSEGAVIASGPAAEVMGASPLIASQIARLFPERGWLTVQDVRSAL